MSQKRRRSRNNRPKKQEQEKSLDEVMRNFADALILNTALKEGELEVAADAAERLDSREALNVPDGRGLSKSLRKAHRQSGKTTYEFLKGLGTGT